MQIQNTNNHNRFTWHASLFPGSETPYVLPSPVRDKEGNAIVNGVSVDEATAAQHSRTIIQGSVTLELHHIHYVL